MSDFLNKLKSVFIVTDPNAAASVPNAPSVDSVDSTAENPQPRANSAQTNQVVNPSDASNDMIEILFKAIENNNLQGFDYLEYKNSLKSLDGVIPDEATKFKSAFEMGKTMGLTKDTLIKAAGHYLSVLAEEDKKFSNSVEHQKSIKIQERATQIQALQNDVSNKKAMIEKLTKEIEADQEQLQVFKTEIDETAMKIDLRNSQFKASYAAVVSQIESDLKKINQFLQ